MPSIQVENLRFDFPSNLSVEKYDDWAYYRRQFSKIYNGIKAIDLLVVDGGLLYIVEVKDYRVHRRVKTISIDMEIAQKVVETLAALLPAKCRAVNGDEQMFAAAACAANAIKIVLHLEQPLKHSRLFPRAINPANLEIKLRQRLKSIDARVLVSESSNMRSLPWAVTRL